MRESLHIVTMSEGRYHLRVGQPARVWQSLLEHYNVTCRTTESLHHVYSGCRSGPQPPWAQLDAGDPLGRRIKLRSLIRLPRGSWTSRERFGPPLIPFVVHLRGAGVQLRDLEEGWRSLINLPR